MDFNSYVFPIPTASYNEDDFKGDLIWIPKKEHFVYRDKIKYNSCNALSQRSLYNKSSTNYFKRRTESELSIRILKRKRNLSVVQKIPSILFSFVNKFVEEEEEKEKLSYIPCLFLKTRDKVSNKVILYFHANYEDLGFTHQICSAMRKSLRMNVLSIEYPGYGMYKSDVECSSEAIQKDSDQIYKFLTEIMNIEESNIIVMGRCIGSGPAVYLASKYKPASLVLVSPFKSIKEAVKSIFNKLGWFLEKFVKERFCNTEDINKVECPTLFIHGKADEVIPWQHSLELISKCECPAKIVTPENMKHNSFDIKRDLVDNIKDFLFLYIDKYNEEAEAEAYYDNTTSDTDEEISVEDPIQFPSFMYKQPI